MIHIADIKAHDLVYLNDSEAHTAGWHIVTGVSKRCSFITASPLGDLDHSVYIPEEEESLILKRFHTAGFPAALDALEEISAGKTVCSDGMVQCMVMYEAQEIAEDALRAVRGEEISDETHRESVSASNKSHPD